MAPPKVEGTVAIVENDKRYEARYECQDDIVIIYITIRAHSKHMPAACTRRPSRECYFANLWTAE